MQEDENHMFLRLRETRYARGTHNAGATNY